MILVYVNAYAHTYTGANIDVPIVSFLVGLSVCPYIHTHTHANTHTHTGTNMDAPIVSFLVEVSACPNVSTCVIWRDTVVPANKSFTYPVKYMVPIYLQEGYPYWYTVTPYNKDFAALEGEVLQVCYLCVYEHVNVCVCTYMHTYTKHTHTYARIHEHADEICLFATARLRPTHLGSPGGRARYLTRAYSYFAHEFGYTGTYNNNMYTYIIHGCMYVYVCAYIHA
jgi:hypothetical protein